MAGYTRQSSYSDGDVIQASDSNTEFDTLVDAFNSTLGHAHDGSTAEGPVIALIGDAGQAVPLNKVEINTLDDSIDFYVDVTGISEEQIKIVDGIVHPATHDDVDLGTPLLMFKNGYFSGTLMLDKLIVDSIEGPGGGVGNPLPRPPLFNSVDINGGTIDGTVIGGDVPAEGSFTTLNADIVDINGGTIDGTTIGADVPSTGRFTSIEADTVDIDGGTIDDTIVGGVTPSTGFFTNLEADTVDIDGGTIDGTKIGDSVPDEGSFTNLNADVVDIDGGTIDGTKIGDSVPDEGSFTNLNADVVDIDGGTIDNVVIGGDVPAEGNFTNLNADTIYIKDGQFEEIELDLVDINGGTIDGVVIGGDVAGEGNFTDVNVADDLLVKGNLTVEGISNLPTIEQVNNININSGTVKWITGSVEPEGVVTASVGSLYAKTTATPDTGTLFMKTSGNGNTGWEEAGAGAGPGDGTNALITETFEGDGVSNTITLANKPASINNTQVYISGVYQLKDTYSLNNKVITFTEIPPDGRSIEVVIASLVTYDSVVIPDVIDEDDMISDSDQHVPTQQSVKAYVDNSATGGSLFKGNNGTVGDAAGIGDIFRVNAQTLNTNVTIDTDQNASAAGPLAIADTVVLTVSGNLTVV